MIVNQLQGRDKALDELINSSYIKTAFPDGNAAYKAGIRAKLAIELNKKVQPENAKK